MITQTFYMSLQPVICYNFNGEVKLVS